MKNTIYFLLLISFLGWNKTFAQVQVDSTLAKYYRTNFAVPNNPAFNILGTQPSEILRPTDIKELSVVASNFFNGNSAIIPKSYAVEIAPYLITRANNITIDKLSESGQRILSSVRISIGTNLSESGSVRNAAAGLRISIIDKGDLRFDKEFSGTFLAILRGRADLDNFFLSKYHEIHKNDSLRSDPVKVLSDSALRAEREKFIKTKVDSIEQFKIKQRIVTGTLNERLNATREFYKAQYWNAEKLDFALAFLGSSPDSLAKNIKFNRFTAWGTYAFPIKSWGQGLLGGNYTNMNRDSLFTNNDKPILIKSTTITLSARLYAGVNRLKGFVEYQAKFLNDAYTLSSRNEKNSFFNALWNLGGEANLVDGIWVNFSAGIRYSTNVNLPRSEFVGSFNIRFALPERFKLN